MIKIYCLVNPYTGFPFYVGATSGVLKDRLYSHVINRFSHSYVSTHSIGSLRNKLIRDIVNGGKAPLIYCLIVVSPDVCNLFEREYYNFFISHGIELMQHNGRFTYQQHYCKK